MALENRVLWRIDESERDELIEGWIKLYNAELHGLYSSPNIIIMIKSGGMRWVGPVGSRREECTWCSSRDI